MPFTDTAGGDWWSIYLFDRFKSNGGAKALPAGTHQFAVELRPYVKLSETSEAIVGDLIAKGALTLIIKTPKITRKQIDIQPIAANSGWEISKARYNKKQIRALNKNIAENSFKSITSKITPAVK